MQLVGRAGVIRRRWMQPSRALSEDLTSTHESLMRAVIPGTNQLQALAQVPPDAGSVTARVSPPTPAHILEEFGDGVAAASLIDALAPLWRRLLHLGLRLLGKRLWVTRACSSTQGREFFSCSALVTCLRLHLAGCALLLFMTTLSAAELCTLLFLRHGSSNCSWTASSLMTARSSPQSPRCGARGELCL